MSTLRYDDFFIFEIYPQSETPLLTQIARFDWLDEANLLHLLPDTLICCQVPPYQLENRIVFGVVDYRTNNSTFFSADVDMTKIRVSGELENEVEVSLFFLSC